MSSNVKVATLDYACVNKCTLLGRKMVRISAGYRTGPGGRLQDHETLEECALREFREETGLIGDPASLAKVAILDSRNPVHGHMIVHVYLITSVTGTLIQDSDEMQDLRWHRTNALPWSKMRYSDQFWTPAALKGNRLLVDLWYNQHEVLDRFKIEAVRSLPDNYISPD